MSSFFSLLFFKGNSPPKRLLISLLLTMLCCAPVHAIPLETVYPSNTVSWSCFNSTSMDDCNSSMMYAINDFVFKFFGIDNSYFFVDTNGFVQLATTSTATFPSDEIGKEWRFSRNNLYAYLAYNTTIGNSDPLPAILPANFSIIKKPARPNSTPTYLNVGVNNLVAPFWDDLKFTSSGSNATNDILHKVQNTLSEIGDTARKQLIVQWTNAGFFGSTTPLGSFQAILYENTGGANPTCDIRLQYRQLTGSDGRAFGNDATIGLQGPASTKDDANNNDGNRSLYYSYGTGSTITGTNVKKPTTIKPLAFNGVPVTLSNNKSICFKWDSTNKKYNISLDKYDPVFLTKITPPPAIPTLIAPKTKCPTKEGVYSWQPGSYAPPTISNVVSYTLKVAKKPNPMPDPVPDDFDPFETSKFSKPFNTLPLPTSYTALTPSQDLIENETYYVAVIASNAQGDTWSDIR